MKCELCDYSSEVMVNFRRHQRDKHKIYMKESTAMDGMECKLCGYSSNGMESFKRHQRDKHGIYARKGGPARTSLMQCTMCAYSSDVRETFQRHQRDKHRIYKREDTAVDKMCMKESPALDKMKCEMCSYTSARIESYKQHQRTKHGIYARKGGPARTSLMQCTMCAYSSDVRKTFLRHQRDKHKIYLMKGMGKRAAAEDKASSYCHLCESKWSSKSELDDHVKSAHLVENETHEKEVDEAADNLNDGTDTPEEIEDKEASVRKPLEKTKLPEQRETEKELELESRKDQPLYFCDQCPYSNAKQGPLKNHITLVHKNRHLANRPGWLPKKERMVAQPKLQCERCPFSTERKSFFRRHVAHVHEKQLWENRR